MSSIGIFDSGIGGLTVLKALRTALPRESFAYLGDTARLPYGSKSQHTIRRYLAQNMAFLHQLGVKALVVACNSASTVIDFKEWRDLPVYGVIQPGASAAAAASHNRRIGVLGTRATVNSGAYVRALKEADGELFVFQQACPLLVPLVEEGWERDDITRQVMRRYLEAPLAAGIDTLILGCTHYPVLHDMVRELTGPNCQLIDSAQTIATQISGDIASGKIEPGSGQSTTDIYMTDTSEMFREVGRRILDPTPVDRWHTADII